MASGTESTEMKRDDVHQVAPAVAAVVLRDTQDQSTLVSPKRRIVIFLSLALALFVSFLDQTSVSTSMPAMGQDLDATSTISWVGTSFLIANTAFQLVNGRLSDIFGRKGCLMTSLTLLAFGDLLCGFAQTSIQLFIFRAVAGIGAGGVNSLVMVIVSDMTTLRERGKYQGFLETFIALGNGIGPLVGGVFSEKVTWRWSFWFVAPVSAVTLVNLFLLLPQPKVDGNWKSRLLMVDFMGMSLSMGMILFLLVFLKPFQGKTHDANFFCRFQSAGEVRHILGIRPW
jgi:MFS family permease